MYISVEGNIGAGKTTYIKLIADKLTTDYGLKVVIIDEPVRLWEQSGILELYYGDVSRWGYLFQTRVFHDRIKSNILAYENHKDADVYISERSIWSDTLFFKALEKAGKLHELEVSTYNDLWSMWERLMPYKPTFFIYLDTPIDICDERIKKRTRDGENAIDTKYLLNLKDEHDTLFLNTNIDVVTEYVYSDHRRDPFEQERLTNTIICKLRNIGFNV